MFKLICKITVSFIFIEALIAPYVFAQAQSNITFCEQLFVEHDSKVKISGSDTIFSDRYIKDVFFKQNAKVYQQELLRMARRASYSLKLARDVDTKYASGASSFYEDLTRFLLIGAAEKLVRPECVGASLTRTAEALSRSGLHSCALIYIEDALTILSSSGPKSQFIEKERALAKKTRHGIENMAKVSLLFGIPGPCQELPGMREKLKALITDLQ